MARRSRRRRPPPPVRPRPIWLAVCRSWLADLIRREPRTRQGARDAAATAPLGELLDRTLDHVDGC